MLYAYFDDSGTHGQSKIYTLAGLLGNKATWENLLQRWMNILASHDLREIHMSEIVNGTGTCARKRMFERKLIHKECYDALAGVDLVHVASAIVMDDWHTLTAKERARLGSPYELVFQSCLQNVARGLENDTSRKGPVDFVFDNADKNLATLGLDRFKEHKESVRYENTLGKVKFDDSISNPALQVADLFSYHCYRHQLIRFGYPHSNDEFPLFPLHIRQLEGMDVAPRGLWDLEALHEILNEIRQLEGDV